MSEMDALLDTLDESRERLLVAIEPLSDEALLEKGAVGAWSIVDVLINLTAWEAELVTGMMRLDQQKRPERLLQALAAPGAYDLERFTENQGRDLDQVFDDLQLVRVKTEDWLAGISERALVEKRKRLDGRSLAQIVAAATYQREQRLLPAVEKYAQQWVAANDLSADDMVPLSTIDLLHEEDNDDNAD